MSQDFQLSSSHFFNKLLISQFAMKKKSEGKEPGADIYFSLELFVKKKKKEKLVNKNKKSYLEGKTVPRYSLKVGFDR